MKKRQCEAIIVILLCITLTVSLSICRNTVKASNNNELIELTIQICDFKEKQTYTTKITKPQIQELQRIFDDLKKRLSTSMSLEATQRIFDNTIISLIRNNLLPNNLNIEHTKKLITYANQYQNIIPVTHQKILIKTNTNAKEGIIQNSFCLIAGNTSNTHFAKPITKLTMRIFDIMDYRSDNIILVKIATILWILLNPISTISQTILQLKGYHYGTSIFFGNYHYYPYPNWLFPAQGWISTTGIHGYQNISGLIWGQKMTSGWQPQDDWYMNYTWRGCVGFTGIIAHVGQDSAYYLGSALQVNVGSNRP